MAHKYMDEETTREPGFIPNLSTLRCAKSKYLKSTHLDEDPIVALYKAKSIQEYAGAIQSIGYSPFFYLHLDQLAVNYV